MPAPFGNQYALGADNGRPPVYQTADELQKKVDEYFEWIKGEYHYATRIKLPTAENDRVTPADINEFGEPKIVSKCIREAEPVTITGLALFLGFCSRQSLYDMQERSEEFSYVVVRARCRVESSYEKRLDNRDKVNGATFALGNMGWATHSKHELSGPGGRALFEGKSDAELATLLKEISGKLDEPQ